MPRTPTATATTITGISTVDLRATEYVYMRAKNNLNFVFHSVQHRIVRITI
jgi:hypothetical protein